SGAGRPAVLRLPPRFKPAVAEAARLAQMMAMSEVILDAFDGAAVPVYALADHEVAGFLERAPDAVRAQAKLADFKGKAGQALAVPGAEGAVERVLFGLGS